jgi:hypothetical protein
LEAELAAQRATSEKQAALAQAEREKQELRNQLAEQLNLILETRDSARGLIVNMSCPLRYGEVLSRVRRS